MLCAGSIWNRISVALFVMILAVGSVGRAQDTGEADLDKAFELKISAESTRDLDTVADLCESAIEKGLDAEGEKQAKELWASTLFQHAQQLSRRIVGPNPDKRWRVFRGEALSRLEKVVELKPEMVEAYTLIARLNVMENGDRDAAEEALGKAIELSADDPAQKSEVLFLRAMLSSDTEQRMKDLNDAIETNESNTDALKVRGAFHDNRAKSLIRQSARATVSGDEEKGKELLDQANEQWGLAAADFAKWFEIDSNSLEACVRLADVYTNIKEYDKAAEALSSAAGIAPENVGIYTSRARIRLMQDNDDLALEDITKAIKIDRQNTEALLMRSSILLSKDRYDEALDDVNAVLENEPYLVRGIAIRSSILAAKQDFEGAIKDTKLLAENFQDEPAYKRQLAMLYNAADQPSRAVAIYDQMLKENENPETDDEKIDRVATLRGRGDARLSLGQHKQAIADYDEALTLMPSYDSEDLDEFDKDRLSGILNNLAWVLATSPESELRNGKRSIELATKAAEFTEFKAAHILSTLASGYAETGDFETARKHAADAVAKAESDEQRSNLSKELESYKKNEPWRELQNVEEEKKADSDDAKSSDDSTADKKQADDKDESGEGDKESTGDNKSGDGDDG